jgi:hypothetical protein
VENALRNDNGMIEARCTFCGKEIKKPKLRITIGKRATKGNKKTYLSKEFDFFSAASLLQEIVHMCLYEFSEHKE